MASAQKQFTMTVSSSATIIVQANLETGNFTQFSNPNTGVNPGDGPVISTVVNHTPGGKFSATCGGSAVNNNGDGCFLQQIVSPSQQELWLKEWWFFPTGYLTSMNRWPHFTRFWAPNNSGTNRTSYELNLISPVGGPQQLQVDISPQGVVVPETLININWDPAQNTNAWHCVVQHIKLNTLGASDGIYELFIDGATLASNHNLNLRGSTNILIGEVWPNSNIGHGPPPAAPNNPYYFDDVLLITGTSNPGCAS